MPSTEPTKSILMASPFCAGRGGSTGFCSRLALAMRLDRVLDVLLGHDGLQALELDIGEVELADLGQHLDHDLELDVLAFFQGLEVDARLHRRLQPAILDRLGGARVDRLLQRFAEQSLAILLLQQPDRHLALAEARHLGGLGELGQALVDLGRQVAGRDDDLELPLQPFGREFRHLHHFTSISVWCGRRDLNPHALRHENLNLACLPIPPRPPDCRPARARAFEPCRRAESRAS